MLKRVPLLIIFMIVFMVGNTFAQLAENPNKTALNTAYVHLHDVYGEYGEALPLYLGNIKNVDNAGTYDMTTYKVLTNLNVVIVNTYRINIYTKAFQINESYSYAFGSLEADRKYYPSMNTWISAEKANNSIPIQLLDYLQKHNYK